MGPQRLSVNQIIKQIRARIVRRRVLQGVTITLSVAAVSLISASILANTFSHKQALLMVLRITPLVFTVAAAWWFVFRALRQKISDTQIARLVEEKISFADRVTTAVEFGEHSRDASPAIVNRLVRDADERVSDADLNKVVDPRHAYAYGAAALTILIAMFAALWWLAPVKGGVSALYAPDGDTVSANAMFINVTPVTSRVPRGSDQKIKAALNGFDTQVAQVFIRKLNDANWLATAMEPAKNKNEFQHVIFNIQDSVVYYAEANGIRSSEQTLEVVDLPYVKQIDLILNFPAFTGMAAKKIENGGDVAALKGTVVRVTAILSAKAKAAQIIMSDGSKIPMTSDFEMTADNEFHFVGQFTVKQAGTYKIELTSDDGERYNGSNEYDITLLEDAPPSVVIDKPGRDMKVTNIQEIFTQAKAEDDFGVSSIEFFYMVNGGEEKRVPLQDLKRDEPKTLSGAHTFFLEEMNLQVGDFISYYAKAKDVTGQESTSDIYFLEVRPFDREFRQSQQQGAPGGGQGEQESNALTKKQREIIAATFRVQREEKQYTPPELDENFGAVALSQEKLKGEAEALVDRIRRRLGERLNTDPQFSKLVEYITNAATEMGAAKDKLRDKNTKEALPPEQRALQQLLKAEALNREIQVGQQSAQGGGGGGQQDQKDLADLFELQLDKMKNQYETVQRQQQQAQSQQQDELARRLQELAQRQQKELEQRMRSQMQQQGGGGGGGQQRQQQEMIEEAQRMARELERLSRDRRDPKMQQAAEQMRQAAEEMKRAQSLASASQSQAAQAEAAAQTQRALQRMEQARRMLNSSQQAGGQQNVQQLRQRAEEAMRRQNDISKGVDELAKNGQAGTSGDKKQQLSERKQALAEQISGLEKDIDQAARGLGSDKQQAADKLREAANAIRRNRIPDRIKQNNQLIDNGYFAQAGEREKIIKDNIEEVVKNLQAAESGANRPKGEGMEEALSRARELTENLESMRKKMEQGGAGSQENQGQNQAGQQQNGRQNGQQQAGQQNGQQGRPGQQQNGQQSQQANQQGRQSQSGQQGGQQSGQQPRGQNGQQAGNQQNGQPQNGQQRGSQRGQQQGGQQSGQQSRSQQQGQQSGGQQSGQQQGGQQQGGQQGQQQAGQQGQQGGGQQQGGQQQGGGQQGQQGQQAGGRQGGQQGGQQTGQPGQQSGERQMFGGGGPPRTSGDRQTASELQQRLNEAQELRRALRGNNDLMRDLDKAIDQLRRINPNAFDDPAQMALLKSEVIDPLRQLEVELARRLQGKLDNNGIGSLSDGDAPDRYRKLIEEYYRRLSSRSAGTKP